MQTISKEVLDTEHKENKETPDDRSWYVVSNSNRKLLVTTSDVTFGQRAVPVVSDHGRRWRDKKTV